MAADRMKKRVTKTEHKRCIDGNFYKTEIDCHSRISVFSKEKKLFECTGEIKRIYNHVFISDAERTKTFNIGPFPVFVLPGSPIEKIINDIEKEKRMRIKLALWAVTHGYNIYAFSQYLHEAIKTNKPAILKSFLRKGHSAYIFICALKNGKQYKITSKKLKEIV